MKLGEKILYLRKQNNLSQEQLGEKINVTRQTISNWELGETSPNPEQLKRISKELKISIEELLNDDKIKDYTLSQSDNKNTLNTIIKYIYMFFLDILVAAIFIILYIWLLIMILFGIASLLLSICLILKYNITNIIPYMPYWCKFITSISLILLSALTILCSILYFAYITKLLNSYTLIHKNIFNKNIEKDNNSKLIKINNILSNKKIILFTKIFLISFIISFIITFVVCIISAKNLSFWHTWNWWQ